MSDTPDLSVIMPAYNEMANISRGVLEDVASFLEKQPFDYEWLLVDDGSSDGTLEALQNFVQGKTNVNVLAYPHQGKGPTIKAALMDAKGKARLFTDFDQSTPLSAVIDFLPFLDNGYDVVIASREIGGAKREDEPWYRHLMGKVFNIVVQTLTLPGIHDSQCGFKLISARAAEKIVPLLQVTVDQKKDPFTGAMDVELLYLARKYGFKIKEKAVVWHHVESLRVAPIKDSIRMFSEVWRIKWADITGRYA